MAIALLDSVMEAPDVAAWLSFPRAIRTLSDDALVGNCLPDLTFSVVLKRISSRANNHLHLKDHSRALGDEA
jgi:hypothetical protein